MKRLALAALLSALAYPALAQDESCGLCDQEVTMNASLARCFLDRYAELDGKKGIALAVDLSACKSDSQVLQRGIVEALPSAQASPVEPTMQFMISRKQLGCLKEKLEEPGLVLDPSATIKLDACNGQTTGN